jgi:carboxypeptidase Taq
MPKAYEQLKELLKKNKILESITHLLDWDQETMMPKKGIQIRSLQSAELMHLVHQKTTSKTYKTALEKCIDITTAQVHLKELDYREKRNLELLRQDYLKAKKLPGKFVKQLAELRSMSSQIWSKAKEENRFEDFAPYLEKIVKAMQKKAEYLGYKDHPYDALLDLYEPMMTVKELDRLFAELKPGLISLVEEISKQKKPNLEVLKQEVSEEKQLEICRLLKNKLGLKDEIARLDTSSHPFCNSISPLDIRLTTKIKTSKPFDAISSTLHECGHGLYEAGLPYDDFGTPLGESCSLGVHESQSRLFETFIGQSLPFVNFLCKQVDHHMPHLDHQAVFAAINFVEPSFIRIESDEVTYCLHVMLRYELEKKLIEGSLKVKDLPKSWNELMKSYLKIVPESDKLGCLQDIHWSAGLFGYFPTYALGNLYAAALYEHLKIAIHDFDQLIAQGNFDKVLSFLQNHIYRFGREKSPKELIQNAVKKELTCEPYLNYLKNKYRK